MDERVQDFIEDIFDFKIDTEYHFRTHYGLTFVFKSEITTIRDNVSSASIIPMGIIYRENDEYYFAPLDETYQINEIVKEFVEKELI